MRIRQLSLALANQIAAGEVIERPASVIKELLENALDAKATSIAIEIGFGGLNYMKVSDNGIGICAEDLHLAIAAHATSKIEHVTDLYHITTMGFRGEALASIASVSRMALYSKTADQTHGMMLSTDETGVRLMPFARTQGTTIEVRDLFFNTPVRKTFLKTERMEYQAIELVVKQFALSAPNVALVLSHNGKQTLALPVGHSEQSHLQRVKKLFGQAFLNDVVLVDERYDNMSLKGWLSQRDYQRSQRDRQWVYLNNRLIKDKLVHQAIGQAYLGILHPGRYPSCLLYVSMPPEQVDVNVHPTKHEVRFRESRLVHSTIVSALSNALQRTPEITEQAQFSPEPMIYSQAPIAFDVSNKNVSHVSPLDSTLGTLSKWVVLNKAFVMMQLTNGSSYLVDIHDIHQQYLTDLLSSKSLPFLRRPLLVPMTVMITPSAYDVLERYQPLVHEIGIEFDFTSEHTLMIRSLPLDLPQVDITQFFAAIQPLWLEKPALLKCLVACQVFDAYNVLPEEWERLLHYVLKDLEASDDIKASCRRLDVEQCHQIMGHKYSYV